MARLFGLIGNRADLGGRVLTHEADALRARAHGGPVLGWGLGFYQGGEVLMRRRPVDDRPDIDIATVAGDVRADVVLGHVRAATMGSLRTENTHPFRYRQWLFAQTGTVTNFEGFRDRLVASVPEFLRSGIRGETDAEVLFHVFLSFLHDRGRLTEALVDHHLVADALRSSLAVVDGMSAEQGGEPGSLNILVSNGDVLTAVHRSAPMKYRSFHGREDADAIIGDDVHLRRRTAELARMRFVLLASDFDEESTPARWKSVPEKSLVMLTRDAEPSIEAL